VQINISFPPAINTPTVPCTLVSLQGFIAS